MNLLIPVLLLIPLGIALIIGVLFWLNNLSVRRYYDAVARYLYAPSISYPRVFSYGSVAGVYKDRKLELRCTVKMRGFYEGSSLGIVVKMQPNMLPEQKGRGFRKIAPYISFDGAWIVFSLEQPFVLKKEVIPEILANLHSVVVSFEKGVGEVIQCFKCNTAIPPADDHCPACGWSWR